MSRKRGLREQPATAHAQQRRPTRAVQGHASGRVRGRRLSWVVLLVLGLAALVLTLVIAHYVLGPADTLAH